MSQRKRRPYPLEFTKATGKQDTFDPRFAYQYPMPSAGGLGLWDVDLAEGYRLNYEALRSFRHMLMPNTFTGDAVRVRGRITGVPLSGVEVLDDLVSLPKNNFFITGTNLPADVLRERFYEGARRGFLQGYEVVPTQHMLYYPADTVKVGEGLFPQNINGLLDHNRVLNPMDEDGTRPGGGWALPTLITDQERQSNNSTTFSLNRYAADRGWHCAFVGTALGSNGEEERWWAPDGLVVTQADSEAILTPNGDRFLMPGERLTAFGYLSIGAAAPETGEFVVRTNAGKTVQTRRPGSSLTQDLAGSLIRVLPADDGVSEEAAQTSFPLFGVLVDPYEPQKRTFYVGAEPYRDTGASDVRALGRVRGDERVLAWNKEGAYRLSTTGSYETAVIEVLGDGGRRSWAEVVPQRQDRYMWIYTDERMVSPFDATRPVEVRFRNDGKRINISTTLRVFEDALPTSTTFAASFPVDATRDEAVNAIATHFGELAAAGLNVVVRIVKNAIKISPDGENTNWVQVFSGLFRATERGFGKIVSGGFDVVALSGERVRSVLVPFKFTGDDVPGSLSGDFRKTATGYSGTNWTWPSPHQLIGPYGFVYTGDDAWKSSLFMASSVSGMVQLGPISGVTAGEVASIMMVTSRFGRRNSAGTPIELQTPESRPYNYVQSSSDVMAPGYPLWIRGQSDSAAGRIGRGGVSSYSRPVNWGKAQLSDRLSHKMFQAILPLPSSTELDEIYSDGNRWLKFSLVPSWDGTTEVRNFPLMREIGERRRSAIVHNGCYPMFRISEGVLPGNKFYGSINADPELLTVALTTEGDADAVSSPGTTMPWAGVPLANVDFNEELYDLIISGIPGYSTGSQFGVPITFGFSSFSLSQVGSELAVYQFNTVGNDVQVSPPSRSGALRVTRDASNRTGAAWWNGTIDAAAFDTVFKVAVTKDSPTNGGDVHGGGFALVIQNDPSGVDLVGDGRLGYDNIAGAVVVEFDTHYDPSDGDRTGSHVAVMTAGTLQVSSSHAFEVAYADLPGNVSLTDGEEHVVRVRYSSNVLDVYVDNMSRPVLTSVMNIVELIQPGPSRQVRIGITAGTTDESSNHDIISWIASRDLDERDNTVPRTREIDVLLGMAVKSSADPLKHFTYLIHVRADGWLAVGDSASDEEVWLVNCHAVNSWSNDPDYFHGSPINVSNGFHIVTHNGHEYPAGFAVPFDSHVEGSGIGERFDLVVIDNFIREISGDDDPSIIPPNRTESAMSRAKLISEIRVVENAVTSPSISALFADVSPSASKQDMTSDTSQPNLWPARLAQKHRWYSILNGIAPLTGRTFNLGEVPLVRKNAYVEYNEGDDVRRRRHVITPIAVINRPSTNVVAYSLQNAGDGFGPDNTVEDLIRLTFGQGDCRKRLVTQVTLSPHQIVESRDPYIVDFWPYPFPYAENMLDRWDLITSRSKQPRSASAFGPLFIRSGSQWRVTDHSRGPGYVHTSGLDIGGGNRFSIAIFFEAVGLGDNEQDVPLEFCVILRNRGGSCHFSAADEPWDTDAKVTGARGERPIPRRVEASGTSAERRLADFLATPLSEAKFSEDNRNVVLVPYDGYQLTSVLGYVYLDMIPGINWEDEAEFDVISELPEYDPHWVWDRLVTDLRDVTPRTGLGEIIKSLERPAADPNDQKERRIAMQVASTALVGAVPERGALSTKDDLEAYDSEPLSAPGAVLSNNTQKISCGNDSIENYTFYCSSEPVSTNHHQVRTRFQIEPGHKAYGQAARIIGMSLQLFASQKAGSQDYAGRGLHTSWLKPVRSFEDYVAMYYGGAAGGPGARPVVNGTATGSAISLGKTGCPVTDWLQNNWVPDGDTSPGVDGRSYASNWRVLAYVGPADREPTAELAEWPLFWFDQINSEARALHGSPPGYVPNGGRVDARVPEASGTGTDRAYQLSAGSGGDGARIVRNGIVAGERDREQVPVVELGNRYTVIAQIKDGEVVKGYVVVYDDPSGAQQVVAYDAPNAEDPKLDLSGGTFTFNHQTGLLEVDWTTDPFGGTMADYVRFTTGTDLTDVITVEDNDLTAPPVAPATGASYVVGYHVQAATDWTAAGAYPGAIMTWDGAAWQLRDPVNDGSTITRIYVKDEDLRYYWSGKPLTGIPNDHTDGIATPYVGVPSTYRWSAHLETMFYEVAYSGGSGTLPSVGDAISWNAGADTGTIAWFSSGNNVAGTLTLIKSAGAVAPEATDSLTDGVWTADVDSVVDGFPATIEGAASYTGTSPGNYQVAATSTPDGERETVLTIRPRNHEDEIRGRDNPAVPTQKRYGLAGGPVQQDALVATVDDVTSYAAVADSSYTLMAVVRRGASTWKLTISGLSTVNIDGPMLATMPSAAQVDSADSLQPELVVTWTAQPGQTTVEDVSYTTPGAQELFDEVTIVQYGPAPGYQGGGWITGDPVRRPDARFSVPSPCFPVYPVCVKHMELREYFDQGPVKQGSLAGFPNRPAAFRTMFRIGDPTSTSPNNWVLSSALTRSRSRLGGDDTVSVYECDGDEISNCTEIRSALNYRAVLANLAQSSSPEVNIPDDVRGLFRWEDRLYEGSLGERHRYLEMVITLGNIPQPYVGNAFYDGTSFTGGGRGAYSTQLELLPRTQDNPDGWRVLRLPFEPDDSGITEVQESGPAPEAELPFPVGLSLTPLFEEVETTGAELIKNGDYVLGLIPDSQSTVVVGSGSSEITNWEVVRGNVKYVRQGTALWHQGIPEAPGPFPADSRVVGLNANADVEPESIVGANLVKNGTFSDHSYKLSGPPIRFVNIAPPGANLNDWEVIQGAVDLKTGWQWQIDNTNTIDLHGTPGNGGIRQTVAVEAGKRYRLRVRYKLNNDHRYGPGPHRVYREASFAIELAVGTSNGPKVVNFSRTLNNKLPDGKNHHPGTDADWFPADTFEQEFVAAATQNMVLTIRSLSSTANYYGVLVGNVSLYEVRAAETSPSKGWLRQKIDVVPGQKYRATMLYWGDPANDAVGGVSDQELLLNGELTSGNFVGNNTWMLLNSGATNITGWTVVAADPSASPSPVQIDWAASDNGGWVDLAGSPGYGGIRQTVTLSAGKYRLSVVAKRNPGGDPSDTRRFKLRITGGVLDTSQVFVATSGTSGAEGGTTYSIDFEAVSPTASYNITISASDPYGDGFYGVFVYSASLREILTPSAAGADHPRLLPDPVREVEAEPEAYRLGVTSVMDLDNAGLNDSNGNVIDSFSDRIVQTFTAPTISSSARLRQVSLPLAHAFWSNATWSYAQASSDQMYVQLWSTDAAGVPDSPLLTSTYVTVSSFWNREWNRIDSNSSMFVVPSDVKTNPDFQAARAQVVQFNFDSDAGNALLAAGTRYALVLRYRDTGVSRGVMPLTVLGVPDTAGYLPVAASFDVASGVLGDEVVVGWTYPSDLLGPYGTAMIVGHRVEVWDGDTLRLRGRVITYREDELVLRAEAAFADLAPGQAIYFGGRPKFYNGSSYVNPSDTSRFGYEVLAVGENTVLSDLGGLSESASGDSPTTAFDVSSSGLPSMRRFEVVVRDPSNVNSVVARHDYSVDINAERNFKTAVFDFIPSTSSVNFDIVSLTEGSYGAAVTNVSVRPVNVVQNPLPRIAVDWDPVPLSAIPEGWRLLGYRVYRRQEGGLYAGPDAVWPPLDREPMHDDYWVDMDGLARYGQSSGRQIETGIKYYYHVRAEYEDVGDALLRRQSPPGGGSPGGNVPMSEHGPLSAEEKALIDQLEAWAVAGTTQASEPISLFPASQSLALPTAHYATLTGDGLLARYYRGADFQTLYLSRTDANINFNWGLRGPVPNNSPFSVEWQGWLVAPSSGQWRFRVSGLGDMSFGISARTDASGNIIGVERQVPQDGIPYVIAEANDVDVATVQTTQPIQLRANEPYYVSIRYKERRNRHGDESSAIRLEWARVSSEDGTLDYFEASTKTLYAQLALGSWTEISLAGAGKGTWTRIADGTAIATPPDGKPYLLLSPQSYPAADLRFRTTIVPTGIQEEIVGVVFGATMAGTSPGDAISFVVFDWKRSGTSGGFAGVSLAEFTGTVSQLTETRFLARLNDDPPYAVIGPITAGAGWAPDTSYEVEVLLNTAGTEATIRINGVDVITNYALGITVDNGMVGFITTGQTASFSAEIGFDVDSPIGAEAFKHHSDITTWSQVAPFDGGPAWDREADQAVQTQSGTPSAIVSPTQEFSGDTDESVAFVMRPTSDSGFIGFIFGYEEQAMPSITSITSAGTVATVTTGSNHNLTTNDIVRITGAVEDEFNLRTAVTVTGPTTFEYTISDMSGASATGTPSFAPMYRFFGFDWRREALAPAIVGRRVFRFSAPVAGDGSNGAPLPAAFDTPGDLSDVLFNNDSPPSTFDDTFEQYAIDTGVAWEPGVTYTVRLETNGDALNIYVSEDGGQEELITSSAIQITGELWTDMAGRVGFYSHFAEDTTYGFYAYRATVQDGAPAVQDFVARSSFETVPPSAFRNPETVSVHAAKSAVPGWVEPRPTGSVQLRSTDGASVKLIKGGVRATYFRDFFYGNPAWPDLAALRGSRADAALAETPYNAWNVLGVGIAEPVTANDGDLYIDASNVLHYYDSGWVAVATTGYVAGSSTIALPDATQLSVSRYNDINVAYNSSVYAGLGWPAAVKSPPSWADADFVFVRDWAWAVYDEATEQYYSYDENGEWVRQRPLGFKNPVKHTIEKTIQLGGNFGPIDGVRPAHQVGMSPVETQFGVRYEGWIEPRFDERYTFHITADDAARFWIDDGTTFEVQDGKTVKRSVSDPTDVFQAAEWFPNNQPVELEYTTSTILKAGKRYRFRLEYYNWGLLHYVQLAWSSPSQPKRTVPSDALYWDDVAPTPSTVRIPGISYQGTLYRGGLNAQYFNQPELVGPSVRRTDPFIDFEWAVDGSPHPSITPERWSARWTGFLEAPSSGVYRFHMMRDDGVRLFLNDVPIIDAWWSAGQMVSNSNESSGGGMMPADLWLEGGRRYKIRVEFFEDRGHAECDLRWSHRSDDDEFESFGVFGADWPNVGPQTLSVGENVALPSGPASGWSATDFQEVKAQHEALPRVPSDVLLYEGAESFGGLYARGGSRVDSGSGTVEVSWRDLAGRPIGDEREQYFQRSFARASMARFRFVDRQYSQSRTRELGTDLILWGASSEQALAGFTGSRGLVGFLPYSAAGDDALFLEGQSAIEQLGGQSPRFVGSDRLGLGTLTIGVLYDRDYFAASVKASTRTPRLIQ